MAGNEPISTEPMRTDATGAAPWSAARERLATADTFWLGTTCADGGPHVVPLLAVWVDDTLCFAASPDSLKARNLAHDPRCVVTTRSLSLDLVVQGTAAKVRDTARLRRVADAYASKHQWEVTVRNGAFHDTEGAPTAGPPPYDVYQVTPATAFGFQTDEALDSTRWRFGPTG